MVLIVQRAGYTLVMTSKPDRRVLPFPDRRAAGRMLAERLADAVDLDQWTERTVVLRPRTCARRPRHEASG